MSGGQGSPSAQWRHVCWLGCMERICWATVVLDMRVRLRWEVGKSERADEGEGLRGREKMETRLKIVWMDLVHDDRFVCSSNVEYAIPTP